MAHQAHNIPWTVLASTLQLKSTNPCQYEAKNFHVRKEPDRGKKMNYFANAFVHNVLDHARGVRKKYPEARNHPSEDEIVLDDDVAKKINATVYRWRLKYKRPMELGPVEEPLRAGLCRHMSETEECTCPLPFRKRKMSAFLKEYIPNATEFDFFHLNDESFFNLEVFKTLILYGEMETIRRICSHPEIGLERWWEQAFGPSSNPDLGWDIICRLAMDSYILFNILHCFPETWSNNGSPVDGYTSLKAYQYLVRRCTKSGWASEVPMYPHRQFFGIEENQFHTLPAPADEIRWAHIMSQTRHSRMMYYPYGLMSYKDFLSFEKAASHYMPQSKDVSHVRWLLCQKGLPVELCNSILKKASYTPTRRLLVPDHPFHPENRTELDKYIAYSWLLIVRCVTIGQVLGMDMEFLLGNMVRMTLETLFGCKCFKLCCPIEDENDSSRKLIKLN